MATFLAPCTFNFRILSAAARTFSVITTPYGTMSNGNDYEWGNI
jgi:hypothetical protein